MAREKEEMAKNTEAPVFDEKREQGKRETFFFLGCCLAIFLHGHSGLNDENGHVILRGLSAIDLLKMLSCPCVCVCVCA